MNYSSFLVTTTFVYFLADFFKGFASLSIKLWILFKGGGSTGITSLFLFEPHNPLLIPSVVSYQEIILINK